MNSKPISSYEDLCKEKERLAEVLKAQKLLIQQDVEELKNELNPILNLSDNISMLLSRENGKDPLVEAGTNIGIDILAGKLLSKSNFILRWILPSILKNLSSHLLPKVIVPVKKSDGRQIPAGTNAREKKTALFCWGKNQQPTILHLMKCRLER
jgi:hypothetical protein